LLIGRIAGFFQPSVESANDVSQIRLTTTATSATFLKATSFSSACDGLRFQQQTFIERLDGMHPRRNVRECSAQIRIMTGRPPTSRTMLATTPRKLSDSVGGQ
jgi:hypothetical protein